MANAGNPYGDGADGMGVTAWREGVAAGTGRPCSARTPLDTRAICSAFAAHAPGLRAQPLIQWARDAGEEYGRAAMAAGRQVRGTDFATWLDSGKSFGSAPSGGRPRRIPQPGGADVTIADPDEVLERCAR